MTPLEQISADLGWRESELGSLKILLGRRDLTKTQQAVLLRASWAMLYAHYEGFVKTALTIFYDEVSKRITNCGDLPKETRAGALLVSGVPRPFFHGRHENAWWVGRQGVVLSLWTKLRATRRVVSGGLSC
jgi:hypothetical protein